MKCRGPSFLNEIKAFPFLPQTHKNCFAGWMEPVIHTTLATERRHVQHYCTVAE